MSTDPDLRIRFAGSFKLGMYAVYTIGVVSFNRFRSYYVHSYVVGVAKNGKFHSIWKRLKPVDGQFSSCGPLNEFDLQTTFIIREP